MARYIGPKCRLCRREGMKLFLKGERCHTVKCAIQKRGDAAAPGGRMFKRGRGSEYGSQLREKQRLKRMYGLLERQFRVIFERAQRRRGNTGSALVEMVARRLDAVVRASGFGFGPSSARQIVAHGLVRVNGRKVDIPSFTVRPGDVVSFTPKEKPRKMLAGLLERTKAYQTPPGWLERDEQNMTVKVLQAPARDEFPFVIREQVIVEGLSK
jgi:small subunit ribosomal protein S4